VLILLYNFIIYTVEQ